MLQNKILEQLQSNHMGKTSHKGIGVYGQYECRHQKYFQTVCYMPGVSADTATREDDTL